jgi:hypothetical protein
MAPRSFGVTNIEARNLLLTSPFGRVVQKVETLPVIGDASYSLQTHTNSTGSSLAKFPVFLLDWMLDDLGFAQTQPLAPSQGFDLLAPDQERSDLQNWQHEMTVVSMVTLEI